VVSERQAEARGGGVPEEGEGATSDREAARRQSQMEEET
jgi:hypothetical protein